MAGLNGIPAGKRRYALTLTEKTVNSIHSYMGQKHAPKSMLSAIVDDFLADLLKTVEELEMAQQRKGEEVGLGDLLTIMGGIMTDKKEQGKLPL